MKLSVVIPVYNEVDNIREIIKRVQATGSASEIIIVDDGSVDGSRDVLAKLKSRKGIKILLHERNQGKGAAVRTGIRAAGGDVILIQDADLEYHPRDYPVLLQPFAEGVADVVYGSRFLGGPRRAVMFWHMIANQLLTLMTNVLYNTILTDMETGYKVFRRQVVEDMVLRSRGFEFEPEFTAKVLKRKYRIFEVPISFNPRDYSQGKKIKLQDAFVAVWALLKYRFVD
jgi:glycosyltransferase involved in cell wall biosynthesis